MISCHHHSPLVFALKRSPIATGMKLMLSALPKCLTSSQVVTVVGNSSSQSSRCGTRKISSSFDNKNGANFRVTIYPDVVSALITRENLSPTFSITTAVLCANKKQSPPLLGNKSIPVFLFFA